VAYRQGTHRIQVRALVQVVEGGEAEPEEVGLAMAVVVVRELEPERARVPWVGSSALLWKKLGG